MHCRYFSESDCSIRVSRSFVQFLCPLHKKLHLLCQHFAYCFYPPIMPKNFAGEIDGSLIVGKLGEFLINFIVTVFIQYAHIELLPQNITRE